MTLPAHLLESLATAAAREGLVDAVFDHADTPVGRLLVVEGPAGICRIAFPEEPEDAVLAEVAGVLGSRVLASRGELAPATQAIGAYLEGDTDRLDLPVDLRLVRQPFRREVLEALHGGVPRGQVVTYAGLAARAGRAGAARAAGTACARNPVPLIVPCHRVVPSGGGIGGYGGGVPRKRALLALEGALES